MQAHIPGGQHKQHISTVYLIIIVTNEKIPAAITTFLSYENLSQSIINC